VRDVKLGQRTSTIHVTLSQNERDEVVGYLTNSDMGSEEGVTLVTGWELHPPPPPVDLRALALGGGSGDDNWDMLSKLPYAAFRKAMQKLKFFIPRKGQLMRSIVDEWVCFSSGENFTNESIGFVADMWPQVVDAYWQLGDLQDTTAPPQQGDGGKGLKESESAKFWYPTLSLNLDIKKALPPEGVKWLFARVRAKSIKNGRFDLVVVICDESGDIVALSHHVTFVLSAARNMASRRSAMPMENKL
jgi:hypothetical protein